MGSLLERIPSHRLSQTAERAFPRLLPALAQGGEDLAPFCPPTTLEGRCPSAWQKPSPSCTLSLFLPLLLSFRLSPRCQNHRWGGESHSVPCFLSPPCVTDVLPESLAFLTWFWLSLHECPACRSCHCMRAAVSPPCLSLDQSVV